MALWPGVVNLTDGLLPKGILEESRSSLRRPPFSPTRPGLADFLACVWPARREGQYLSIYRTDFRGPTPEIQGVALSSNITNHARMSFRHGAALVRVIRLRNRYDFLRHVRTIPLWPCGLLQPSRTYARLAWPNTNLAGSARGGSGRRQSSIQPGFLPSIKKGRLRRYWRRIRN
jgi:hypothetical protein